MRSKGGGGRGSLVAGTSRERLAASDHRRCWVRLPLATALLAAAVLASCRLDMQDQPRLKPLRRSDFYEDGRASRPLVAGTVARGQLREDTYFYTGQAGKQAGDALPFAATKDVLERGRERFNIYCSPCHGRTGEGNGMIVQRGYRRPPSYHIDRLRNAPLGHFFDVMTNGFGAMPDYAAQVPPYDRWCIAAYIRALQFSQNAPAALVPAGTELPSPPPPVAGTPGSGATPGEAAPASGNLAAPEQPPGVVQRKAAQEQQKREQKEQKLKEKLERK